jgi:MFS family permease
VPQRNFAAGVVNGALFNLSVALVEPSVVLVVFVSHFTGSIFLQGLAGVVRPAAWCLPQLWTSSHVERRALAKPIYLAVSLVRAVMWLLLIIVVFTVRDPPVLLSAFFLLIVGEQLTAGFSGLAFMDMVAKVIPPAGRGVFFSWRMSLGGLLGIGGGVVVAALLAPESPFDFPANFGLLFALAGAAAIAAFLVWLTVREPPIEPRGQGGGLRRQVRLALAIWRQDANYRAYLQARVALMLVMVITPLVTVYVREGFGVPVGTVAVYPTVIAAGRVLCTAAAGWISARFGNRRLLRLGAGLGMLTLGMVVLAGLLGLSAEVAGWYFLAVFAMVAARDAALQVALAALSINVAPEDKRPIYMGFANTVMGVVMLASSLVGVLVGVLGFEGVFLLALAPVVFGVWRLGALRDPSYR